MLETKRLLLIPLTYRQLLLYIKNDGSLERNLNINPTHRNISPELAEAITQSILPMVADQSKNYLFSTLWTLIDKNKQVMVGDLCFKGEPNLAGEIEIGYGTYTDSQNKGFMTEAVGGIIQWTLTYPTIHNITAETEKINKASYRVLLKNNFITCYENDDFMFWQLKLVDVRFRL